MKKLGFGCMRLPMAGEEVDYAEFTKMADSYMKEGFNYFDTARLYIKGKSELAIRSCVANRYPRESFVLTDKLSFSCFNKEEEIRPLFFDQLNSTGVEYFDYYLMHALSFERYRKFKECNAFKVAEELKKEGRIKHIGISFHDTAEVLDIILTEQPSVEIVQLQINYLDWEDPNIQSRKCYEVARKHGKPVLVMEPVRGGELANLPEDAKAHLDALGGGSPASYAIRFAASLDGVHMVLSGMSNQEQMLDNLSYMKDFVPLDKRERDAVECVASVLRSKKLIQCTSCRYCIDGCPKNIPIPDLFACMNLHQTEGGGEKAYQLHTEKGGKAGDCIKCGLCEKTCPQHLNIRELLVDVKYTFGA